MTANLDIDLLRTFLVVVETASFSRAGDRLSRSQSAISFQIKRLESAVGQQLLLRTPRSVVLTPHGVELLSHARRMVAMNDELLARINGPALRGVVRLGTPEDFATSHLPNVLARFAQTYPLVSLEVNCDLTLRLMTGFDAGNFDIVLVKREPAQKNRGVRVWREPLVWVGGASDPPENGPLPLAVSPFPCVYRKRATEALDAAERAWRISYTCASLAGTLAAVRAGLGFTVLPKDMVPPGLRTVGLGLLPKLPDTEIALLAAPKLSEPAARLQQHIIRSLELVP